jgi:uncharacterized protein YidB (DUF937 family)
MGLLDDMLGALSGTQPAQQEPLAQAIHALIGTPEAPGLGLHGLLRRLEQGGLGNVVQSWLGPGPNLPITPEQLHAALGDEEVRAMAGRVGLEPSELVAKLSEHLPGLVDRLSANGRLPEEEA